MGSYAGWVDPLDDVVSRQYERWMYPAPIFDIPAWLANNWQWFDPSHAHNLFWPDRAYREGLDILVAGCGTNQAAVIAFTNPTARVVGIDVSDASLNHHRLLSQRHGLDNLEVHPLPIEQVDALQRDFDLIITTGVLHHLDDPQLGMNALARCLRPDGVLAVMLYATYGRLGVQMLQSVFTDLGLGQNEHSLEIVREAIPALDAAHPVQSYLNIARDLQDDAGLVDTFLHGRERAYTIDECQTMVAAAGLTFQDLFLKAPYYAPRGTGNAFFDAVAELPREQQWSIMERVNPRNACHFFLACRPDRPKDGYAIDAGDVSAYIPALRKACRIEGSTVYRSDWQLSLDPVQTALVGGIDDRSSVSENVAAVLRGDPGAQLDAHELAGIAQSLFQRLWQLDVIALRIRQ